MIASLHPEEMTTEERAAAFEAAVQADVQALRDSEAARQAEFAEARRRVVYRERLWRPVGHTLSEAHGLRVVPHPTLPANIKSGDGADPARARGDLRRLLADRLPRLLGVAPQALPDLTTATNGELEWAALFYAAMVELRGDDLAASDPGDLFFSKEIPAAHHPPQFVDEGLQHIKGRGQPGRKERDPNLDLILTQDIIGMAARGEIEQSNIIPAIMRALGVKRAKAFELQKEALALLGAKGESINPTI